MPNLSFRKPRIANLGQVFGIVYRANEKALQLHQDIGEDLAAFHAPSECGDIAYSGVDRIMDEAIAQVETLTGMAWPDIYGEVQARTGGRWMNWLVYNSMLPLPNREG